MAIEAELADGRILEFPDGTDPAVIRSTVQRIVGGGKGTAAPAAQAASAPTPAPQAAPVTNNTAEGLQNYVPRRQPLPLPGANEPRPYKDKAEAIDDAVNLLEEGVDKEKIISSFGRMGIPWKDIVARGQERNSEFFRPQANAPVATATGRAPAPELKAAPEPGWVQGTANLFKRVDAGVGDVATSYLLQSGAIDPEGAGQLLARNAKQRAAAAPSAEIKQGMEAIGNAEGYADAAKQLALNPRATFTLMAESVLTSLPAAAPAMVLGPAGFVTRSVAGGATSGGMEYGSVMADVLQDKRVDLLNPNAVAKALSDPQIIAEIKDKAAKRGLIIGIVDGLSMGIAGRFLRPAQALIAEGKLAGAAAKKATVAAWGKELATQMAGGAGGEFAAQKATGENKPADVLLEALAEGVTAPLEARANLREAAELEQRARVPSAADYEELAKGKGFLRPEAKPAESTDLGDLGQVRPGDDLTTPIKTPVSAAPVEGGEEQAATEAATDEAVTEAKIAEETERLKQKGYTANNAKRIATAKVRREEIENKPKSTIIDTTGQLPTKIGEWPDAALAATLDFQMQKPEGSRNQPLIAALQTEIDRRAQDKGAADVGQPISEAGGVSTELAGEPSQEQPAGGAGESATDGVVPAGENVVPTGEGKTVEPPALELDSREAYAQRTQDDPNAPPYEDTDARVNRVADRYEQAGMPEKAAEARDSLTKMRPNYMSTAEREEQQAQELAQQEEAATEEAAPVVEGEQPKGKRGRKALSPEERAAKEAERKVYRAEYTKAERNFSQGKNNVVEQLDRANQPLDEGEFANEDELEQAQEDKRAEKADAIKRLLEIEQKFRGSALGKRAKALLDDRNKITQQELDKVKRGIEIRKKTDLNDLRGVSEKGSSILASRAASEKVNPGLSDVTNGAQAITQILKTGNAFQKFLAKRIRSAVAGVKVVVIEKGDPLPEALKTGRNAEAWERARGVYSTGANTVYLRGASFGADHGISNVTALHELLHAATNQKIKLGILANNRGFDVDSKVARFTEELNTMMINAQLNYEYLLERGAISPELQRIVEATRDVDEETGEVSYEVFELPQEFLAYGMTDPEFQKFLNRIPGRRTDESAFTRFVKDILELFNLGVDKFTALSDLIDVTDNLLSAKKTSTMKLVEEGMPNDLSAQRKQKRDADDLRQTYDKVKEIFEKSAASTQFKNRGIKQRALEKMNPQEMMEWVKSFWPKATKAQREVMARLPSIEFLGDWVKELGLPQISEAADLMTEQIGAQKVLAENTEQVIYQLKRAFKADPSLQDKLTRVVYESTGVEVDPSDPNAAERIAELDAKYQALGPEGQAMYKLVKEHYEDRGDLYLQLLEDNLNNLPNLDEDSKKNLLAVLRKNYEAGERIRPYFPFVRDEGDYWLSIGKGDDKEFYIYENMGDRDADRRRIMRERGISEDDTQIGDSIDSLRQDAYEASALLRAVFDAIDKAPTQVNETDADAARFKDGLKDSVYQAYLNVMPERSFRGMFRHRKGRAGYRTDLIQNIATTDGKMNTQLARLEYAQRIRNTVDSAQSAIEGRPELQPFVDELRRRVNNFLSPDPFGWQDAIAGVMGRIGFIYMLAGPSLPLLQPLALASSGMAILWGNYKTNPATASGALLRAFADIPAYGVTTTLSDGTTRYQWPSIVNSKVLTGDELQAVRDLAQSGMHESTLARDVWNYASKPTSAFVKQPGKEVEYYANKTMQGLDTVVGSPFHILEKWTREAMFLAAYRLGRKDKLSHDEAVKKAISSMKEALGDYDTHAKPRWMQRGFGKMAFALKTFAVLITQQTLGNLFKAIPFLNKEGKKEAITKFSGIMLSMGLLAGASGVPLATVFYSFAAGLVMALGDELDDEDDDEAELREMDKGLWFRSVWLPRNIPDVKIGGVSLYDWIDRGVINAVTGMDVASRVQLATVWGQETPKPSKTTMEAALNLAKDYFAGAYFGMIEQWANAYDAYQLGDKQRAQELMSPKGIKDWKKATRYDEEGVQINGKDLLEPGALTDLEIWAQRIGFAPDIVSTLQKEGFKAKAAVEKVRIERERLLDKLDIADRKGTDEGDAEYDRIMEEEVEPFNDKYPNAELKQSQINDALKARRKVRDDSIAGVTITKKQADALDPLLERMEKRIEERHEKRKEQIKAKEEEKQRIELRGMANKE